MAKLSLEDLHLFHNIDREVLSRMIICLGRDPAESLLVMALWLCLEDLNFQGIVFKIKSLPNIMLNAMADEAAICLRCLESNIPPPPPQNGFFLAIPQTESIVGRGISLIQIYQNKYTLIAGVKTFLNKVCALVFTDILVQAFHNNINNNYNSNNNNNHHPSRALLIYDYPLTIPGFPHPTFGNVTIIPRRPNYSFPSQGIWGWSLNIEVPIDDRSLFLTFSRGYPVTEMEIRQLFSTYYGENCVEEVYLEPPPPPPQQPLLLSREEEEEEEEEEGGGGGMVYGERQQRLYARMVLRDITIIDKILSKGPIAKYKINGKHVWARKFERR